MTTGLDPAVLLRVSADIAERLASSRDALGVARAVVPALGQVLDAQVVNLALRVDERTLRLLASVGLAPELVDAWGEFDVAAAVPIAATVRDGQARWIPDSEAVREEYAALPPGRSASLCTLPLTDDGAVIGVLGLAWRERHDFGEAEQQMLRTVAALTSATLARHPLPGPVRLQAREHAAPPGTAIVELYRPRAARCVVRGVAAQPAGRSAFVSLLDANPELPTRGVDAVDGILALCRRRHIPPAMVGQAVAELGHEMDAEITGAHVEISGDGRWLAAAPLDHAIAIATTGATSGTDAPPTAGTLAGECVVRADGASPGAVVAVTLAVHTEPADAERVTACARLAVRSAARWGATAVIEVLHRELLLRELDVCVRGAVAIVLDGSSPQGQGAPEPLRRRLPALPVAAGLARRFAEAALAPQDRAEHGDRVALVVDELVANAIRHANETVDVLVTPLPGGVEIAVTDDDDRHPDTQGGTSHAESGRGYTLLSALADELGVTPRAEGGKVVWARLGWRG